MNQEKLIKTLKKADNLKKGGELALANEFLSIENKVDSVAEKADKIAENVDLKLAEISDELKKKLEEEFSYEIDPEKIRGEKGKDGIDGVDGVDGIDGKDGKDGIDGLDGKDGVDGQNGLPGADGSPDTPKQIKEKLETLKKDKRLDKSAIKGLEDFIDKKGLDFALGVLDQRTKFLINKQGGNGNGGGTPGGNDTEVQFNDGGVFGGDANFKWDKTVGQLQIGEDNINTGIANTPLAVGGTINDYFSISIQNLSNGTAAFTDFVASADNDGETLAGHFSNFGIANSGFSADSAGNVRSVLLRVAGTGYSVDDILTLVGGDNNCEVKVLTVGGSGEILTYELFANGTGYIRQKGLVTTVIPSGGTNATIDVYTTYNDTAINPNTGYVYTAGGDMIVASDSDEPGHVIKLNVGGFAIEDTKVIIEDDKTTFLTDIEIKGIVPIQDYSVARDVDGNIETVTYDNGREITYTRTAGIITSYTDGVYIWTINRTSGIFTGITVTTI